MARSCEELVQKGIVEGRVPDKVRSFSCLLVDGKIDDLEASWHNLPRHQQAADFTIPSSTETGFHPDDYW